MGWNTEPSLLNLLSGNFLGSTLAEPGCMVGGVSGRGEKEEGEQSWISKSPV